MTNSRSYVILPADYEIDVPPERCPSTLAIATIRHRAELYLGKHVIYYAQNKRSVSPQIARIVEVYPRFVMLKYPCYAPNGEFRQFLTEFINWTALYCGAYRIEYFDSDI